MNREHEPLPWPVDLWRKFGLYLISRITNAQADNPYWDMTPEERQAIADSDLAAGGVDKL